MILTHPLVIKIGKIFEEKTGNIIGPKQYSMVENRLKLRALTLGINNFEDYEKYFNDHQNLEIEALIGLLTTHHTFFFREFNHFEFLRDQGLPSLVQALKKEKEKKIRVWSAAASRGQEVYSLGMFLDYHLKTLDPQMDFEILGTDIDVESIKIAQKGVYSKEELKSVPQVYLQNHWVPVSHDSLQIQSKIKVKTKFEVVNLLDLDQFLKNKKFHIIFCRNVFIYFEQSQIKKIVSKFLEHLDLNGYLILGVSESITSYLLPVRPLGGSIYEHKNKTLNDLKTVKEVNRESGQRNFKVNPIKVLVVDDSKTIHALMKKILTREEGFEIVYIANNGKEALDFLSSHPEVEMITLDLHMPEIDGLEFLTRYREKKAPVLIVSAVNRDDPNSPGRKALSLGAFDYVEKPTIENLEQIGNEIRSKLKTGFMIVNKFNDKKENSFLVEKSSTHQTVSSIFRQSSTDVTSKLNFIKELKPLNQGHKFQNDVNSNKSLNSYNPTISSQSFKSPSSQLKSISSKSTQPKSKFTQSESMSPKPKQLKSLHPEPLPSRSLQDKSLKLSKSSDQPIISQNFINNQFSNKQSLNKQFVTQQIFNKQSDHQQIASKQRVNESTLNKKVTDKQGVDKPSVGKQVIDNQMANKHTINNHNISNHTINKQVVNKNIFEKQSVNQALVAKQSISESYASKQSSNKLSNFQSESIKKVLIVDDSATVRKILESIITEDSRLKVCASTGNPLEVENLINQFKPDLITLDIHMPEMDGVTLLKKYIDRYPIPTIMISSLSISEGNQVLDALQSGAVDYIQKPNFKDLSNKKAEILEKLYHASLAKIKKNLRTKVTHKVAEKPILQNNSLVVIGSSTGGTEALREIFEMLPDEIPPILVAQHIPAVFSKALADRLNGLVKFKVTEASDDELIKPNHVYIAPGGKQMGIKNLKGELRISVTEDPPVNRHKPSVDYLFQSVARNFPDASSVIGIILTGMGGDGAKGLKQLKDQKAITIAQDEATSVVYGMPRVAYEIGAVTYQLPLFEIAHFVIRIINKKALKSA